MPTLTIEIEDDVLHRAEELASANGLTVSQMVERSVRLMTSVRPVSADRTVPPPSSSDATSAAADEDLAPLTRSLAGRLARGGVDRSDEDLLYDALAEKYGIDTDRLR